MALRQYQGGSRRPLEAAVDPTQRQLLQQGPQSLHAATFYTYVQYPLRLGRQCWPFEYVVKDAHRSHNWIPFLMQELVLS